MILWKQISTDERDSFVREKWVEGLSATKIAALTIGATRNSIISNVHKQGLKRDPQVSRMNTLEGNRQWRSSSERPTKSKLGAKPKLIIAGNGSVHEKPEGHTPRLGVKADAFAPLPGSAPVPWLERPFGQCAWPVGGEGADTLSCGLACSSGAYCAAHLKIRNGPGTVSEREAVKQTEKVAA